MPRKKTFQVVREAGKLGPYAEMPMLPDEIQVQVHLSRNDKPQPFHLICGKDSMLALVAGAGAVEFKGVHAARLALKPGDFVYVPAGTPHRLLPAEESVVLRYKAQPAGLEGVAWFCPGCGGELHRAVWDTAADSSHAKYREIGTHFAGDASLRTCKSCGSVHDAPDVAAFRWDEMEKQAAAG
jgi:3-hydroxyanthranilate 3,4-dioxygenase